MYRVGVLGGAFDPIHEGHVIIAKQALVVCDEVLVAPCLNSRYDKKMESFHHRLHMCYQACIRFGVSIHSSRVEEMCGANGRSYDLMHFVKETWSKEVGDVEVVCIIGEDTAPKIDRWFQAEKLKKEFRFITVERPHAEGNRDMWYKHKPNIYMPSFTELNYNSTSIRERLRNKEYDVAKRSLHPHVLKYIMEENLYHE